MANLMLQKGSTMTEVGQLAKYKAPEQTKTYKPLEHIDAVEMVINKATDFGYKVKNEEYGLSKDGNKMFGLIKFESTSHLDHSHMVGVRNSYDKSVAFGVVAGLNIMVCDNLVFNGDIKLTNKHTSSLEAQLLVKCVFDSMKYIYPAMEKDIDDYKEIPVKDEIACHIILSLAKEGLINASDTVNVMNEFKNPTFSENKEYSLNSLYNAFTFTLKKYSILTIIERQMKLQIAMKTIASTLNF